MSACSSSASSQEAGEGDHGAGVARARTRAARPRTAAARPVSPRLGGLGGQHPRGPAPGWARSPPRAGRGRSRRRGSRSCPTPRGRRRRARRPARAGPRALAPPRSPEATRSPQITTTSPASRSTSAAARTALADGSAPLPERRWACAPARKPSEARALASQVVERGRRGAGAAERRRQGAQRRLGGAGREAQRGARVGVERRGPGARHHQARAVAAHRLAHAQVEDRRLLHELGVEHEDRAGVVDVGDPGRQLGARERAGVGAGERPGAARVHVRASRGPRAAGAGPGSPPRWWPPPPTSAAVRSPDCFRAPRPPRRARAPRRPRAGSRRRAPSAR